VLFRSEHTSHDNYFCLVAKFVIQTRWTAENRYSSNCTIRRQLAGLRHHLHMSHFPNQKGETVHILLHNARDECNIRHGVCSP